MDQSTGFPIFVALLSLPLAGPFVRGWIARRQLQALRSGHRPFWLPFRRVQ